jgi:hypothetical protein
MGALQLEWWLTTECPLPYALGLFGALLYASMLSMYYSFRGPVGGSL